MPTKRTRVGRPQSPHIAPETVDLFIRHETLRPIYMACLQSDEVVCRSADPDVHCPECREYLNATAKLSEVLGAKPWEISGVDADSAEPPTGLDEMRAKSWRRSWRLRCELEAAVEQRKAAP